MTEQEFRDWAKANPDNQGFLDYYATKSIEGWKRNHPTDVALSARLDRLDRALSAKDTAIRQADLKFFAYKKATEIGVDFALLDGYALADEKSIETKLAQLAEATKAKSVSDVNSAMIAHAHRPGGSA